MAPRKSLWPTVAGCSSRRASSVRSPSKATDIACNMVTRFGMHEKLGQVTYETPRRTFLGEDALAHYAEREFSERTAREIDCAIRELVTASFEKALSILRVYRKQLDEGVKLLLAKETLTHAEMPVLRELPIAAAAASGRSIRI